MTDYLDLPMLTSVFAMSMLTVVTLGVIVRESVSIEKPYRGHLLPFLGISVGGIGLTSTLAYEYILATDSMFVHAVEFALLILIYISFVFSVGRLWRIVSQQVLVAVGCVQTLFVCIYLVATFIGPAHMHSVQATAITLGSLVFYLYIMYALITIEQKHT